MSNVKIIRPDGVTFQEVLIKFYSDQIHQMRDPRLLHQNFFSSCVSDNDGYQTIIRHLVRDHETNQQLRSIKKRKTIGLE